MRKVPRHGTAGSKGGPLGFVIYIFGCPPRRRLQVFSSAITGLLPTGVQHLPFSWIHVAKMHLPRLKNIYL